MGDVEAKETREGAAPRDEAHGPFIGTLLAPMLAWPLAPAVGWMREDRSIWACHSRITAAWWAPTCSLLRSCGPRSRLQWHVR